MKGKTILTIYTSSIRAHQTFFLKISSRQGSSPFLTCNFKVLKIGKSTSSGSIHILGLEFMQIWKARERRRIANGTKHLDMEAYS
jgi:hypothetical protein